ncbi:hypothetical protein TELCIR_02124, partial [Teladorsagia circumcincta]
SSSEAVNFVSTGAAMIVRMRGLPYDCSEQQIQETDVHRFFCSIKQANAIPWISYGRKAMVRAGCDLGMYRATVGSQAKNQFVESILD